MTRAGIAWVSVSAALLSGYFILAKETLAVVNAATMTFLFFSISALCSVLLAVCRREQQLLFKGMFSHSWFILTYAAAMLLMAWGLESVSSANAAFLSRLSLVVAVVIGLFQGERIQRGELVGVVMATSGALAIAYHPGSITPGSLAVIAGAALYGVNYSIAKQRLAEIPAAVLGFQRGAVAMLAGLIMGAFTGLSNPDSWTMAIVLIAGLASALGYYAFYRGLARAPMFAVMTVRAAEPAIVLLYAWLLYDAVPTAASLMFGTIIVAGIMLMQSKREEHASTEEMHVRVVRDHGKTLVETLQA